MPRPGTEIILSDAAPVGGAILDTGQTFHLGVSARGPVDRPATIRSLRDYERQLGPRAGGITAYDSASALFSEGGGTLYFARLAGPNAAAATGTVGVVDAAAGSPGAWGNNLSVALEGPSGLEGAAAQVIAKQNAPAPSRRRASSEEPDVSAQAVALESTGIQVAVYESGTPVDRSPQLTTAGDAVAWSRGSDWVSLTASDESAALAAVTAVSLTGGADDANITPTIAQAALDRFEYALGPGQVSFPGNTDPDIRTAILDHCDRMRRVALLDASDTDDPTALAVDAVGQHGKTGSRLAAMFAPPLLYPGPAGGTMITVPYSAVQAGIIARNDAQTGNPNQPAAGVMGVSRRAQGLAHSYTDDDREQLNELGLTLAVVRYGDVRTYGSRTVAGPTEPNWTWFGGSRVVMAIAHEADAVAENYVHRQIDGRRHLFSQLEADLRDLCLRYFNLGALYGDEPEEAFRVDTSEQLNTIETIKAGEIHAAIWLKTSPPGEWVQIEIVKTPIDLSLAA